MTKRLVPLVPLIATAGALASAGALGFPGTAAAAGGADPQLRWRSKASTASPSPVARSPER